MTRLIGARCKTSNGFSRGVLIFHLFNHKNFGNIIISSKIKIQDSKSWNNFYTFLHKVVIYKANRLRLQN